jgi:Trk K+ transport system NAD-binding subunit
VERPIVLCGLGRMGTKVLEYLNAAALPVVVVDNTCREDDPRLKGARLVFGDCRRREVLEAAGVADARGVLILTGDDLLNITTTLVVRSLNPEVRVVLRMFNQHLIGRLGQAVRNVFALSTSLLTAPILALTAMTGQALAAFSLDGHAEGRRQIVEVSIGPASDLRGRAIGEVLGPREAVAVAHLHERGVGGPAWCLLLDVDVEARLQAGDRLVICGEPPVLAALLASAGADDVPDLIWAGWARRMGRVVYQTWRTWTGRSDARRGRGPAGAPGARAGGGAPGADVWELEALRTASFAYASGLCGPGKAPHKPEAQAKGAFSREILENLPPGAQRTRPSERRWDGCSCPVPLPPASVEAGSRVTRTALKAGVFDSGSVVAGTSTFASG